MRRFGVVVGLLLPLPTQALSGLSISDFVHSAILPTIPFVSRGNFSTRAIALAEEITTVRSFCTNLTRRFRDLNWEEDPCGQVRWRASMLTSKKHPLIYAEFGTGKITTLVLSGVHPDEFTPIPMAFRFARFLTENPAVLEKDRRVVIAPLVNPDGFLIDRPTRTNSHGIDLNRNLFTTDWYANARKAWLGQRGNIGRMFPGYFPNSEVETLFQAHLIDDFQPSKIFSVHAPLGFLDYDGPGDGQPATASDQAQKARRLVYVISEKSQNYRVVDYTFYPGSLGNYAGNDRKIPTVTLELETTDPAKVEEYWRKFLPGLLQTIQYQFEVTTNERVRTSRVFYGMNAPRTPEPH